MGSLRILLIALVLFTVFVLFMARRANAQELEPAPHFTAADTLAAIDAAAADTGISRRWLYAIVQCESRLNPYAVGRRGELGAVQLLPGGLLPVFYASGYSDPFNPYESVYFLADQLVLGRARHWTCA